MPRFIWKNCLSCWQKKDWLKTKDLNNSYSICKYLREDLLVNNVLRDNLIVLRRTCRLSKIFRSSSFPILPMAHERTEMKNKYRSITYNEHLRLSVPLQQQRCHYFVLYNNTFQHRFVWCYLTEMFLPAQQLPYLSLGSILYACQDPHLCPPNKANTAIRFLSEQLKKQERLIS